MPTQVDLEMHSESDWALAVQKVQDAARDLELAFGLLTQVARFAGQPREQRFAGAAAQTVAEVADAANLARVRVADAARQLAALDRADWKAAGEP